ncbi:CLUMA_CG017743, isoform A [Clunio marinus]|uniref:CLUMA_CG017743, isoform A n=1 Tax=Clunio marinus TaxID=568069 RepID=A0A1J1IX02_9DIPT|nr:CLUMA_CG017743, isoform A [Clunio marinus]
MLSIASEENIFARHLIFYEIIGRTKENVYTAYQSITQFPDKNCQSINQRVNQTTKSDKGTQRAQNKHQGFDQLSRRKVFLFWIFLTLFIFVVAREENFEGQSC